MTRSATTATPIAIIGMACWYPGADSLTTFWENILARRIQFRPMLDQRLPLSEYHDPDRSVPDKTYSTRAAYIDGFAFDWARNRVPKSSYESADLAHWLALDVALKALSDAGYGPETLNRDMTGVILGNTLTGEFSRAATMRTRWPVVARAIRKTGVARGLNGLDLESFIGSVEGTFKSVFPPVTEDTLAGALSNTIAGRICNVLDLHGGGYTVDGACASSLLAVVDAARQLAAGSLDLAFAGGVDLSLDTFEIIGFAKTEALTAGRMAVYDRNGDGFLPGEGCGFVILKRLADAVRDQDRVYAVLHGWGVSSDGKGALTAPSVAGQAMAIERAYAMAGYALGDVDFVEGHGTGTAVGDAVEISALAEVLAQSPGTGRVGVTSLKSIIGHTKAAAGIGAFIKAAMAVNRRVLPPTAGITQPHSLFGDLADGRLYPITDGIPRRAEDVIRAGVSAMGFGGINTHVTLASGDTPDTHLEPLLGEARVLASAEAAEILPFSARSMRELARQLADIRNRSADMADGELCDLAWDCAGQMSDADPYRAVIVAEDPNQLAARLDAAVAILDTGVLPDRIRIDSGLWMAEKKGTPRFGFLFPGQGSQRINMARALEHRFEWARSLTAHADRVAEQIGTGPLWKRVCQPNAEQMSADRRAHTEATLAQTELAQPALCLTSLVWLERLRRIGIQPIRVAGHSLGEITALAAGGVIDACDAIQLAAIRGRAVADSAGPDGCMAWIEGTAADIQPLVARAEDYVTIANINSPTQVVISGTEAGVASVMAAAGVDGRRSGRLAVSHAFHSRMMAAAAEHLRKAARSMPIRQAAIPIISSMDGQALAIESLGDFLADQICSPVNFIQTIETVAADVDILVEVGPGRVLTGLVAAISPEGPPCLPVESRSGDWDLKDLVAHAFAAGARIRWDHLFSERLIRPFVPAAQKQFLSNPIEGPMAVPMRDTDTASLQLISRAVVRPVPSVSPVAPAPEPVPQIRQRAAEGDLEPVLSLLYRIVTKITGFDPNTLSKELRVLDDLNMDSLKVTELIGDMAMTLDLAGEFDFGAYMNASLAEIAEATASRLKKRNRTVSEVPDLSMPQSQVPTAEWPLGRPPQSPWVRSFVETFIPMGDSKDAIAVETARHEGRTLLVGPSDSFADHLADGLADRGADITRYPSMNRIEDSLDLAVVERIILMPTEHPDSDFRMRHSDHTRALCRLAATLSDRVRSLVLIQRGDGRFSSGPPPIKAWAGSIAREHPAMAVTAVDLAASITDYSQAAQIVIGVMADTPGFRVRGVEADLVVRAPAYPVVRIHAMAPRSALPGPEDVIVATGGGKGVTAELALALAKRYQARMALIGRTTVDSESEDDTSTISALMERYRRNGLQARYYSCDVVDPESVRQTLSDITRDMGPVTGLIHGAGANIPRPAATVGVDEALAEMAPKVDGACFFLDQFESAPLRLLVGLTSVIGVTGMPGNACYALANEQLNRLFQAYGRRHPDCHVVNTAYSIWGEIGMGARLGSVNALAAQGIDAIAPEQGVTRFLDLIDRSLPTPQVIIASRMGDLFHHPEITAAPEAWRFVRDIRSLTPGVEAVARVHLSRKTDPYLADHVYQGTCLFPTVFGLEAMAQAAATALGVGWFDSLTIQDIVLAAPIMVGDAGADIEIYAQVDDGPGTATVRAGIRSRMRGYAEDDFSAIFTLDAGEVAPTITVPDGPALAMTDTDYYGTILFQGESFHRLAAIRALTSDNTTGGQMIFDTTYDANGTDGWLLGDPYWRDSLLQSPQLVIPQDRSLPVRIQTIRCFKRPDAVSGPVTGMTTVQRTDPRTFSVTIHAQDATGRVLEIMNRYELTVLAHDTAVVSGPQIAQRVAAAMVPASESAPAENVVPETMLNPYLSLAADVTFFPANGGPQGQMVFVHRFVPDFKAFANPSRSIYFSNLFSWMGQTRELSVIPILSQIRELFATGQWGLVTNRADVRILGDCVGDQRIVECRMWMRRLGGTKNSNMEMGFDWTAIDPDGVIERIAAGRMTATWVHIKGHGQVAPEALPDFYAEFAQAMAPDIDRPTVLPPAPEPLGAIEPGRFLYAAHEGPNTAVPLETLDVTTGFAEANLVGNVYFANYSVWMGRVRDKFFYTCDPEAYGVTGELRCLTCSIEHLREAMPFDTIRVTMGLKKHYPCGADLYFEYFRVDSEGNTEKLAFGTQTAVWLHRGADGRAEARPLPNAMAEALRRRIADHEAAISDANQSDIQVHLVAGSANRGADRRPEPGIVVDGHVIRTGPDAVGGGLKVKPEKP